MDGFFNLIIYNMKKIIYLAITLISISILVLYIKYGTADNWNGKTFSEIFLFADPNIRIQKTKKEFESHSNQIILNITYMSGDSEDVIIQPYSTINVYENPEFKILQPEGLLSGFGHPILICTNWDIKIDGVSIKKGETIAIGVSKLKIKNDVRGKKLNKNTY